MLKTRKQIRDSFAASGQSITAWAKSKGYTPNTVIAILADDEENPRYKCLRGEAHNIHVAFLPLWLSAIDVSLIAHVGLLRTGTGVRI